MTIIDLTTSIENIERKMLMLSFKKKQKSELNEIKLIDKEISCLLSIVKNELNNSELVTPEILDIIYKVQECRLQLLIYKNEIEGKSNQNLLKELESLWSTYNNKNENYPLKAYPNS